MDGEVVIRDICNKFRYGADVVANSSKIYQLALLRGFNKKHKNLAIAAGALYFYCKTSGKSITVNMLLNLLPLEQEEITNVYNDMKLNNMR